MADLERLSFGLDVPPDQMTPPPAPVVSLNAERQRRARARAKRHEIVAPTPVSIAVIDMLIDLHWLAEADAEDRIKIGAANAALLLDLAQHR